MPASCALDFDHIGLAQRSRLGGLLTTDVSLAGGGETPGAEGDRAFRRDTLPGAATDDPKTNLARAVADVRHLDQALRSDPIEDPIAAPSRENGAVSLEGIQHRRAHLGELAEQVDLRQDLVLQTVGER
jgi:hypothetical protein